MEKWKDGGVGISDIVANLCTHFLVSKIARVDDSITEVVKEDASLSFNGTIYVSEIIKKVLC